MINKKALLFLVLCLAFMGYSFSIYLQPSLRAGTTSSQQQQLSADGKLVWQKYNCQSCHQLYGLGGYLGPDLTNVYSAPGKTEAYLKAIILGGNKQMQGFKLSEEEQHQLMEFLKVADQSGSADPRKFRIESDGMIR
ncbi:MAG: cytochrome c [Bacteroidia bacterium]